MDGKGVLLRLAAAKLNGRGELVPAGSELRGQREANRDTRLLARGHISLRAAALGPSQAGRPAAVARHRDPGVVDQDQLLLDRLTRQEVMVLAGEPGRFTADVGE